jgi:tRNA(Ile)-lysidine synthase
LNDDDILQKLEPYLSRAPKIWVGFSGGIDSLALLHWCAQQDFAAKLAAIHVHHGLSEQANSWQAQCEAYCEKFGIELLCKRVELRDSGDGIEAEARAQRYRVFEQTIGSGELLLTAHHLGDQSETFLYRLMRGAGLKGLRAIPQSRPLAKGVLLRPLLNIERRCLEDYVRAESLSWVEDQSNQDQTFDRNYIRHNLIPVIEQRWPKAQQTIARATQLLADAGSLLEEYAREDLKRCQLREERLGQSIDATQLQAFNRERRQLILRAWLAMHIPHLPQAKQLSQIENLLKSRQDATPCVEFGHLQLKRFQNRLYLCPALAPASFEELDWNGVDELNFGNGFYLTSRSTVQHAMKVSRRQQGLRCQPVDRHHSQSLKKLFLEYSLEPWLRDHIPIIWVNNKIIAVGDLFCCDHSFQHAFEGIKWLYRR